MLGLLPEVRAQADRYPLALIVTGVLLYSTGPVMLQASGVSGPVFSFWRLWIGAGALGAATLLHHRRRSPWPTAAQWRVALWAGAAFGLHQLLFFTAVKVTTVVDVSLMAALSPVVTAVGARWMFGERPGRRFWQWAALAIGGAALLALSASSGPSGNPAGMTMAIANVGFFAVFFLLSKKGRDHLPLLPFLFGTITVSAVVVTGFTAATGGAVTAVDRTDVLLAAGVALGPGAIGHLVMTWPLRVVPANIPPVMKLAQPVLSGLLAWWLLSEAMTWVHLGAGAVVIGGAAGAIMSRDGRALRAEAAAHGTETSAAVPTDD